MSEQQQHEHLVEMFNRTPQKVRFSYDTKPGFAPTVVVFEPFGVKTIPGGYTRPVKRVDQTFGPSVVERRTGGALIRSDSEDAAKVRAQLASNKVAAEKAAIEATEARAQAAAERAVAAEVEGKRKVGEPVQGVAGGRHKP